MASWSRRGDFDCQQKRKPKQDDLREACGPGGLDLIGECFKTARKSALMQVVAKRSNRLATQTDRPLSMLPAIPPEGSTPEELLRSS